MRPCGSDSDAHSPPFDAPHHRFAMVASAQMDIEGSELIALRDMAPWVSLPTAKRPILLITMHNVTRRLQPQHAAEVMRTISAYEVRHVWFTQAITHRSKGSAFFFALSLTFSLSLCLSIFLFIYLTVSLSHQR